MIDRIAGYRQFKLTVFYDSLKRVAVNFIGTIKNIDYMGEHPMRT